MKTHPVKARVIMGQIPQLRDVIPGSSTITKSGRAADTPTASRARTSAHRSNRRSGGHVRRDDDHASLPEGHALPFVIDRIKSMAGEIFRRRGDGRPRQAYTTGELEFLGEEVPLKVPAVSLRAGDGPRPPCSPPPWAPSPCRAGRNTRSRRPRTRCWRTSSTTGPAWRCSAKAGWTRRSRCFSAPVRATRGPAVPNALGLALLYKKDYPAAEKSFTESLRLRATSWRRSTTGASATWRCRGSTRRARLPGRPRRAAVAGEAECLREPRPRLRPEVAMDRRGAAVLARPRRRPGAPPGPARARDRPGAPREVPRRPRRLPGRPQGEPRGRRRELQRGALPDRRGAARPWRSSTWERAATAGPETEEGRLRESAPQRGALQAEEPR